MKKMKIFAVLSISFLCASSLLASMQRATATVSAYALDPTDDLYFYQSWTPAPSWPVIDIVYTQVSLVNFTHFRLLTRASQGIPLTNQWQSFYWLLDTGTPAPIWWNLIDSNDLSVSYYVGVSWSASGPLWVQMNMYDSGGVHEILHEDARNHPETYFDGDTVSIIIPLSLIGDPASIKMVAGSSDGIGSSDGKHDKAPNAGHVELDLPVELAARVDIDPNTLNLKSKGKWTTGYIEVPEGYDVHNINVSTIKLNDTIHVDLSAPTAIGDYDNDLIPDLMVMFSRTDVVQLIVAEGIEFANVTISLSGRLNDGNCFSGSDVIKVSGLVGDVNCDGKVNARDVVLGILACCSHSGSPRWNDNANFAPLWDVIDLRDIAKLLCHYGEHY